MIMRNNNNMRNNNMINKSYLFIFYYNYNDKRNTIFRR